jgi:hypothetical protein
LVGSFVWGEFDHLLHVCVCFKHVCKPMMTNNPRPSYRPPNQNQKNSPQLAGLRDLAPAVAAHVAAPTEATAAELAAKVCVCVCVCMMRGGERRRFFWWGEGGVTQ